MATQRELFNTFQQLEVQEQVAAIEGYLKDHELDESSSTVFSMLMMNLLIDMEAWQHAGELVRRLNTIATSLRDFNELQFNA